MSTLLDSYFPYDTGVGSNVTEAQWREMAELWFPTGVVTGATNEFAVAQRAAGANMSVDVATGQARIQGQFGESTSSKNVGISANGSGNPRVDLIVLRNDFLNNQIVLDVLVGTPAVNPVEPTLTQNTVMWEIPLAAVDVAAAAVSIVTANIRDRRFKVRELQQFVYKMPVRVVTTTALAASTATATTRVANANGALAAVDGVTLVAGDRLLDKDHATGAVRGIWQVVDPGSASTPWRLQRPLDADNDADVVSGLQVRVTAGTVNAGTTWILTTLDPIVVGTTALTFVQLSAIKGNALGDTAYFDGTNWVLLPKGAGLQQLRMNAGATAPEWFTAPNVGPALIRTMIGPELMTTNTAQVANRTKACRVIKGGTITSVGIGVQTQSGNTSVGVLRGAAGRALPTTRVVTSGTTACPAAGFATVTVASTAVDETTDWLAIDSDNATINLYTGGFTSSLAGNLGLGYMAYQDGTFPLPASPSMTTEIGMYPILIGVP
ncbi:MAG: hypothetical protein SHS37scaffold145_10 [Phage 71_18]|nr:MAG: hypothetical protein SHS37scaffold145_10 [Phage 71_18]